MNPLSLPWWAKAVLATILLVAITWAIHLYNESLRDEGRAEIQSILDKAKAGQAAELAALTTEYRAKEQAWQTEKEGITRDARNKLKTAQAALPAAAAAGDELRDRIAQLTSKCSTPASAPGAGTGSPTANPTNALLADVQRRLDKAAEELAGYADASSIAGQACELSYDKTN